jgi:hypothetical protein
LINFIYLGPLVEALLVLLRLRDAGRVLSLLGMG